MSNVPENLRYTKDHEWASVTDGVATIGITDYAQHSLGDVVYFDVPRVGDELSTHEAFGSVESVKAVSEVFTPVAGEVVGVNVGLNDSPEVVNNDPYGEGWMVKIKMANPGEADAMLSAVGSGRRPQVWQGCSTRASPLRRWSVQPRLKRFTRRSGSGSWNGIF